MNHFLGKILIVFFLSASVKNGKMEKHNNQSMKANVIRKIEFNIHYQKKCNINCIKKSLASLELVTRWQV